MPDILTLLKVLRWSADKIVMGTNNFILLANYHNFHQTVKVSRIAIHKTTEQEQKL